MQLDNQRDHDQHVADTRGDGMTDGVVPPAPVVPHHRNVQDVDGVARLPAGERSWRYPVWQLEAEGGVLPGLEEVLRNFGVEDPWTRAAFLLGGNDRLSGKRPLDALREGLVEDVARAARSVGEHGAD